MDGVTTRLLTLIHATVMTAGKMEEIFSNVMFVSLFVWGFKVLRDFIHDHYIQRPKEREKQEGNSSNLEPAHCKVAIPQ